MPYSRFPLATCFKHGNAHSLIPMSQFIPPPLLVSLMPPALTGRFFTTNTIWKTIVQIVVVVVQSLSHVQLFVAPCTVAALSFHCLLETVSFVMQILVVVVVVFAFVVFALGVICPKFIRFMSKKFLYISSFSSLTVSGFMFIALTHFELTFVYGMRQRLGLSFSLSIWISSFSKIIC